MSDKSVRKVLDWPNHRVGSKPSDPIRFEEEAAKGKTIADLNNRDDLILVTDSQDVAAIKEMFPQAADYDSFFAQVDEGEYLELWGFDGSVAYLDKSVYPIDIGLPQPMDMNEQGDVSTGEGWEGQSQDNLSQQLNPTTEQNISPFTQSQFVPTGSQITAPTSKGEGDSEDINPDAYLLFNCPKCGFGFAMGPNEQDETIKQKQWICVMCDYAYPVDDEEDLLELEMGIDDDDDGEVPAIKKEDPSLWVEPCPSCEGSGRNEVSGRPCTYCKGKGKIPKYEEGGDIDDTTLEDSPDACQCCPDEDCGCGDCGYCEREPLPWTDLDEEEVKDPRIDKDKDKEKGADLSPEAQKIAGTDPATVEAKSREKPKLEVDVSDKITILGKTGSGKTNLIKVLLSDILKDYQFVLLDALGNFAEYDGQPNIDYHQVSPADTAGVDEILYSALERGDCMVVMDEVDRYQTKPGTMLNELVNVGRNYNVGGIFAARRTADVNKDILANSPYIFTFQHILPQDLDVLIDWFAQPEEVFRDLQEFEAILFHNGEQMWVGKVPEKPTTKPTAKPTPPKKPKGKDKEKGKEPEPGPEKGKEPSEPKEKGPPTPPSGEGKEPEVPPEEEPEEEPEPEEPEAEKEEGAFKCDQCGKTFKWQKDFLNHMVVHAP